MKSVDGKGSYIEAHVGFRQCMFTLDNNFIYLGVFTYLLKINKKLYAAFADFNITFETLAGQEMKAIYF